MRKNHVQVIDKGQVAYKPMWDEQEQLLQQKVQQKGRGEKPTHQLFLVEHTPVYTLGKSGKAEHILITEEQRKQLGIEYYHINRGGDITFHGPEQLVVYPILDLEQFKTDLGWYLRSLEEVVIKVLALYGLQGERSQGETGVWLQPNEPALARKICAMGIRCSRWVTMHGIAFNINTPLHFFDYIVPCGIKGKAVTSLEKELGYAVPLETIKQQWLQAFCEVFDVTVH